MIVPGKQAILIFINDAWPPVVGDLVSITDQGVSLREWMFTSGKEAGIVHMTERFFPFVVLYCVEQDPAQRPTLPLAR